MPSNTVALAAPGRILLLSCYELGHQPVGLASPAGFLREAGYAPALQDLAVTRLDPAAVGRAALVGISVPMHTALRIGLRVAERVRALNPTAHICFYGLYAALNAELLLSGPADSVLGGECEPALVALATALAAGTAPTAPGLSTRTRRSAPRLARTQFPLPARDGLPALSTYAKLALPVPGAKAGTAAAGEERTVGYVEASRGCKHHCLHCPLPPAYAGRFFVVPVEIVLADVAQQVAAGAQHITFGDPDFLNGPGHALRVVRALHARFPQLTYDVTVKVEHLLRHAEHLPELARTGCLFIVSAVESLSDTVLAHLNKGHTRADVERALALTREAGIALRPTWLPFTPWATLADYRELLAFVWTEGLVHHVDPVQLAVRLLVPPGSALLDTPQFAPYQGPLQPDALSHAWAHPDPRMDALQQQVAAIVEEAARVGTTDGETFRAIHAAACGIAGDGAAVTVLPPAPWLPPPAPRLTEPWFC